MFETLHTVARTYLAIRIGGIQFSPLETCVAVITLAAALVSALSLWHIGQREDHVARLAALRRGARRAEAAVLAPTRRWYHRLGTMLAGGPLMGTANQERILVSLSAAGIKGQGALVTVIAAKLVSTVACATASWLVLEWYHLLMSKPVLQLVIVVCALALGWLLPETVVTRLAARRKVRLEHGVPDALDLLVICAEAGLSLDQAIEQVGIELQMSAPDVAEEFAATAAEMRVLPDRGLALENLVRRTDLATLRSMVATLVQSIRFGTPLADSLRVISQEMRSDRMARFEERAARLPVLLTMPLMLCILPSLMMLLGTPLILRIIDVVHGLRTGHL